MYRITEIDASWWIEKQTASGRWIALGLRPTFLLAQKMVEQLEARIDEAV